jgi:hypothetical protein
MFMTFAFFPAASLAQAILLNNLTEAGVESSSEIEPNGELMIYLLKDSSWQEAGSLSYDRFLRERKIDLAGIISSTDTVTLRLVQKAGGKAHLDAVLLGGEAPIQVNDEEGMAIRKLSKKDYDVIGLEQGSMVFSFLVNTNSKMLEVSARIEATTISQTPFLFPVQNGEWNISEASDFYTYQMNSKEETSGSDQILSRVANQEPFFKHSCLPGSGHPQGYVYGWVMNDEKNLYVALDVTIDNTMDGDKDYAKVYVKTGAGVKAFKLSAPETRWGKTAFIYTDKVAYQHKVYEFTIPLQELDMDDSKNIGQLSLAFSVYGTAADPIEFEVGDYVYDEDAGTIGIKVIRPRAAFYEGEVRVGYTISEGTAEQGKDYTVQEAVYESTLVFENKQEEATIQIAIIDDDDDEPDQEEFTISIFIAETDHYTEVVGPSQITLSIRDNDRPQIRFNKAAYETIERDGIGIDIQRTGDCEGAATVTYTVNDITTTFDKDYNVGKTGTITLGNGQIQNDDLWISIVNDFEVEEAETFEITLSNPSQGYELGSPSKTIIKIIDNDVLEFDGGVIQFESATYTIDENTDQGQAVITVARTPKEDDYYYAFSTVGEDEGEESIISVVFSTSDGTAVKGSDYTETTGTLTFAEGETRKTFSIPILDDSTVEGNETLSLTLSNPTGDAVLGEQCSATLTIIENDVRSSGGGGGGGSSSAIVPPKEIPPNIANLPDGTIIDRMKGYIAFSDPVKMDDVKKEILLSYNAELSEKNSTHTPRVYYWDAEKNNWVALATYPSEEGKVKAINDGGYKGWFVVFGVIQPAFSDSQGNWADQVINRMNGLGMIEGYPIEGETLLRTAKPERQVTHAEFTMFISRMLNIDIDDPKLSLISVEESKTLLRSKFADVDEIPEWALRATGTLAKAGLLAETGGKFQADMPITRIEAAVMTSKALKVLTTCKPADISKFIDKDEIPDWAKSEIVEGAMTGYPDGTIRPSGNITRAEALTLLYKIFVEGLGW